MTRAARKIPEGGWPRLLSAERGAAYCDVSVPTFLSVIAPHVPAMQIASRKRWDRVMLDKWLDRQAEGEGDWLKGFDQ